MGDYSASINKERRPHNLLALANSYSILNLDRSKKDVLGGRAPRTYVCIQLRALIVIIITMQPRYLRTHTLTLTHTHVHFTYIHTYIDFIKLARCVTKAS